MSSFSQTKVLESLGDLYKEEGNSVITALRNRKKINKSSIT